MKSRRGFFSALAAVAGSGSVPVMAKRAATSEKFVLGTYPICNKCKNVMLSEERDGKEVFRCLFGECGNFGRLFEVPVMELKQAGFVSNVQLAKENRQRQAEHERWKESRELASQRHYGSLSGAIRT